MEPFAPAQAGVPEHPDSIPCERGRRIPPPTQFWGLPAPSTVTLEVAGRTSGRTISLPVAVVLVERQRYLVSMLGDDVQWVKNVRAAGGRAVLRSGGREPVLLEVVPADQRAPSCGHICSARQERAPTSP